MKKYLHFVLSFFCYVLGGVFLILGIAGLILPIIPGIPLLLVSLLFFMSAMKGKKKAAFKRKVHRHIRHFKSKLGLK